MPATHTYDQIAAYADGLDSAPELDGLTEDGQDYWRSEHGRDEASLWATKRAPLRGTADTLTGGTSTMGDMLLERPLTALIERLNRRGRQYARQRATVAED